MDVDKKGKRLSATQASSGEEEDDVNCHQQKQQQSLTLQVTTVKHRDSLVTEQQLFRATSRTSTGSSYSSYSSSSPSPSPFGDFSNNGDFSNGDFSNSDYYSSSGVGSPVPSLTDDIRVLPNDPRQSVVMGSNSGNSDMLGNIKGDNSSNRKEERIVAKKKKRCNTVLGLTDDNGKGSGGAGQGMLVVTKKTLEERQSKGVRTRRRHLSLDPLPMRLRALPQSFWHQPNEPPNIAPSSIYPVLPPLFSRSPEDDVIDVKPITPPDELESKNSKQAPPGEDRVKITVDNPDLLLKLFEDVERAGGAKRPTKGREREGRSPRDRVERRGIIRHHSFADRVRSNSKSMTSSLPTPSVTSLPSGGGDPCMVECVTDKLFPQLTLDRRVGKNVGRGNNNAEMTSRATLQVETVAVKEEGGEITITTLPSINFDSRHNYSQMLSELITHI